MEKVRSIVLFPFMMESHVNPFMALAAQLEKRTPYGITFVTTTPVAEKLTTALPSSSSIRLVELPTKSSEHGQNLLQTAESFRPAFESFLSDFCGKAGRGSVCLITDFLVAWAVEVANDLGIFVSVFMTSGAYGSAVSFSVWLHLPHTTTDEEEFLVPEFPRPLRIGRTQLPHYLLHANSEDSCAKLMQRLFSLCFRSDGFLFNTAEGMENLGLEYFGRKSGLPVWPIGPIVLSSGGRSAEKKARWCMDWLDLQRPASVLYIAFGSTDTISPSQMKDLAVGLEAGGRPFIWVVKPPIGSPPTEAFKAEWLPEGFEERVAKRNQGILFKGWAPQVDILSHKSTGAFLSHCGWNSIVEGLGNGLPIIAWPLAAEQFFNAIMLVEEARVAVEIARGSSSKVDPERVAEMVEMVMGKTQKGEEMRWNVGRAKEMMAAAVREEAGFTGSSVRAFDDFVVAAFASSKEQEQAEVPNDKHPLTSVDTRMENINATKIEC